MEKFHSLTRASAENFSGEANGKKDRKLAKSTKKIALFSLFQGGGNEKRPKNSTFKPASIYYICTMFENSGGARPGGARRGGGAADAHAHL